MTNRISIDRHKKLELSNIQKIRTIYLVLTKGKSEICEAQILRDTNKKSYWKVFQ